jgi:peptidoglycan/xylan/chitin deacetylase (PgdA/CDA1 family)
MMGVFRTLRILVLPQALVVGVVALLVFAAAHPQTALQSVAVARAQVLIRPVHDNFRLRISVVPGFSRVEAAPSHAPTGAPIPSLPPAVMGANTAVDCVQHACIALSFDDGPNELTTPKILDILEQRHVAASFFLVGMHVGGNEDLIRRMDAAGFEIGNHTWDHHDMTKLTSDQVRQELLQTQTAITATGAPVPTLFRPPYGAIDPSVVKDAGLQTALWNEDPRDWQATDPALLAQNIVDNARPGGVVDLHDIHQVTVDALPSVIDQLRQRGYTFVSVSDLMHSRERPAGEPFYGYAPPAQ